MDAVICFVDRDFRIIKKTIRNLRDYVLDDEDNIYIITNMRNKRFFSRKWIVTNRIVLIDENCIVEGLTFDGLQKMLSVHFSYNVKPGWYLQQFLKMGFANSKYAKDQYLIWDSDTIPLHKLPLLSPNGKYFLASKTENHKPYFDTMERLLGFGKLESFSFIAEHMVINVGYMKELINKISYSAIEGKNWFEKIINASSKDDVGIFSEFETYGNYCSKYYPGAYEIRTLRTLREAGMLLGRGVTRGELETLGRMGFDTASFESYDIPINYRGWINRFDRRLIQLINWYDRKFK